MMLGSPHWRDHLDVALDALKERRLETAMRMFDELDELYPAQNPTGPGWVFEVPYHAKRTETFRPRNGRLQLTTPRLQTRSRRVVIAMLYLVTQENNRSHARANEGIRLSDLNKMAGDATSAIWQHASDGLRDLGIPGKVGMVYKPAICIEDDFDPAPVRLERRRREIGGH